MQRYLLAQALSAHDEKPAVQSNDDLGNANCDQVPLFYSIRHQTTVPDVIEDIGIDLPQHEKQQDVPGGIFVASIDKVEAGVVTGWVCICGDGHDSFQALVAIDDKVVVSKTIEKEYTSPPAEIVGICLERDSVEEEKQTVKVLEFAIGFPAIPVGVHSIRIFIDATKYSQVGTWVEAYHSPLRFEESVIEPSDKAVISRKDAIILHRNNQLTKLWNHVRTQFPWKLAEKDGEDIPLFIDQTPEYKAVILIQSEPQLQIRRAAIRNSWGPSAKDANIILRFIVDIRDDRTKVQVESSTDMILIKKEVGMSMRVHRILYGLDHVVRESRASFYFISHDSMLLIPERLASFLDSLRDRGDAFIGSMRSGPIVTDTASQWYEKDHWRFGDRDGDPDAPIQYPRHARSHLYGFSAPIARYLARNKEVLHVYSNEDISVGTWMLGLEIEYINDLLLYCDIRSCSTNDARSRDAKCIAFIESSCNGICSTDTMSDMFKKCTLVDQV